MCSHQIIIILLFLAVFTGLPVLAQDDARHVQDVMDTSRSSWIESASFEKEATANFGKLMIHIKGEDITYLDVPVQVWLKFKKAESLGSFYTDHIKNRYERVKGEPLWKRYDSTLDPPVQAMVQCAFNEECEPLLLHYIETAQKSIVVAAYAFTRTRIAAALVSAHVRGVDISFKVDARQAEYASAARQLDYLSRNGIPVTRISMKGEYSAMHNKFMVIDGRFVLSGSYNFTMTAGVANWENLMWVDSPVIAARYLKAWKMIVSE